MLGIGVIEGFFGPEWSWPARHQFCTNLRGYGGEFYIYAPKRDSYLRKNWMQNHPQEVWDELKKLSLKCRSEKIKFGIGFSPFEIHTHWNTQTKNKLSQKLNQLQELDFDYLGLFFDDMRGSPDLAEIQIEIVQFVKSLTSKKILFCPTYYSTDPILDKVFGQRPELYLEKISKLPQDIEILWTGSKVIPKFISGDELKEVAQILKRKPFIWDNYFANDGPKQCKFLKLKPLEGRTKEVLQQSAGWAFNLMNQAALSEILFSSSASVIKDSKSPAVAFEEALSKVAQADLLDKYKLIFCEQGLDGIDPETKALLNKKLIPSGAPAEVLDWLNGKYLVGPECLTD